MEIKNVGQRLVRCRIISILILFLLKYLGRFNMHLEEFSYSNMKCQELDEFFEKVKKEGSLSIKHVLTETWYENVKNGAKKVWLGKQKKYDCKYFPVIWLMEEETWPLINSGLIILEKETKKKQILRNKLKKIVLDERSDAMPAAFEITALCRFMKDKVLIEIDPIVNSDENNKKADILIKIDSRDIFVELTSMTKELASPEQRTGVLSLEKMKYQVISKIKEEAKQLGFAEKPTILIISLSPKVGSDHLTAKEAIEEVLHFHPKVTAVLVSDSYLFKCGAWYFNDKAEFQFTAKEKDYIINLLQLNGNLVSSRYSKQYII